MDFYHFSHYSSVLSAKLRRHTVVRRQIRGRPVEVGVGSWRQGRSPSGGRHSSDRVVVVESGHGVGLLRRLDGTAVWDPKLAGWHELSGLGSS